MVEIFWPELFKVEYRTEGTTLYVKKSEESATPAKPRKQKVTALQIKIWFNRIWGAIEIKIDHREMLFPEVYFYLKQFVRTQHEY